ncbi:hypothetical protein P8S54_09795 [Thiomicrospira sp. R3]|uniref:hypothetical protein n=1 Tax=Thiomicrospira sp. R3 TaxID=3035472 RepID=UPI00259B6E58|nr:hypothetical protein [Thiomicrospira sp. R3]WFE68489.1 hypothetical protein P8S54_09795 [Thiomicrospira sp. R3]
MIEATLADLRSPKQFQQWDEVVHLVDARKKNAVGYFVPQSLSALFEPFLQQIEVQRKTELLIRIATAQKHDPIEEGALSDGLV